MTERFWSKVNITDTCWEWTAARHSDGYGIIARPGHGTGWLLAHRYSAMLHFGMFDRRLQVLHHCDNPPCVRPEHLFLGEHGVNMRDMVAKGRHIFQTNPEVAAARGRMGKGVPHKRIAVQPRGVRLA